MKNFNKVFGLLALFLLMFPVLMFAADFKVGEQPSFSSGEKTTENLYMAGGAVVSAGNANKDLLIAGGTVLVSGPVTDDLFIVGGNITVLGQISGDARIGGGNIIVSSNILGDAVVGGGQVMLSGKMIGGDVVVAGGMVKIDSEVKGNAKIAGGEVYINAPIKGNVDIKAQKLTLGPNADLGGNLKYSAEKALTIEDGGKVRGETFFTEIKGYTKKDMAGWMAGLVTFLFLVKFLGLLVASLIIGLVFHRYSKELVEKATVNPLKELGRGIVTFIVLPVFSVILLITIVGIPFGILGLLSFVILLIFANIITPIFLGALFHKWISRGLNYVVNWKTILLGVVVYTILGLIPLLSWIAVSVSVAITIGAMLNIKWRIMKEWR